MTDQRATYPVEIAGVYRELKLFEVAPGLRIAILNILGDTELVKACAQAFKEKIIVLLAHLDIVLWGVFKTILHFVGDFGDGIETHHSGRTLDSMGLFHQVFQNVRIARRFFQLQDTLIEFLNVVFRFRLEVTDEF